MKRSAWCSLWYAPEIRRKLLVTLGLLNLYRFCANVLVPGADRAVLDRVIQSSGAAGSAIGIFDLLSGGTLSQFSFLAMGGLSLHHRSDHPATAGADHASLAGANERRSARGAEMDGDYVS